MDPSQRAEKGMPSWVQAVLVTLLIVIVGAFMVYMYLYDTDAPLPACDTDIRQVAIEQRC